MNIEMDDSYAHFHCRSDRKANLKILHLTVVLHAQKPWLQRY
jgi:hypothetical protein